MIKKEDITPDDESWLAQTFQAKIVSVQDGDHISMSIIFANDSHRRGFHQMVMDPTDVRRRGFSDRFKENLRELNASVPPIIDYRRASPLRILAA